MMLVLPATKGCNGTRSSFFVITTFCLQLQLLSLFLVNAVYAVNITVEGEHHAYNETAISTKILTLAPAAAVKLDASNIPAGIKFVVFEAHHQRHNVTLSYDEPRTINPLTRDRFVNGRDVGLAVLLKPSESNASVWLINPFQDLELLVHVVVVLHSETEPLPGGCNMEFSVEIAPYMKLQENPIENILEYQHARLGSPRGVVAPPCDTSFFFITYEVYAYYLKENDYSEEEFFRGITIMNDVKSIREHATRVKPLTTASAQRTRSIFMSYPGRGVIYNVISTYEKNESPYVPVGSYNCDFGSAIDGCGKLSGVTGIIIVTVLAVMGFVVALRGHQWFNLPMVFFGFIGAALPTFILVAKYSDLAPHERDIATLVCGVIGAVVWLLIWKILGFPLLSILPGGCLLGFLIISSVLFTVLGNEDIFRSDINYWLIVVCATLVVPILLIPFGVLLSVFSCSIVGSYTVIFAADRFLGGSISYILLNVLKRAVYEDIYKASNQVPFQGKDIVLLAVWAVLAFIGLSLQFYASLDRPPFPPPAACSTHPRRGSSSSRYRSMSPRSSRSRGSKRKSRSRKTRRTPLGILPVGDEVITVVTRRSGQVRAPPTEHAEENEPLLYSVQIVPSNAVVGQNHERTPTFYAAC